jgi:hypothetical protein
MTLEPNDLIDEYQDAIINIYEVERLTCLSGLDNNFILNGKNILVWHYDVMSKAPRHSDTAHYTTNMDDIFWCSCELLYFTANLFLYRPYINSPLTDAYDSGKDTIYPNLQNIPGRRYDMYADLVCQVAYNYWDRIGDLIDSFFPGLNRPDRVYFSTVIRNIPQQFHNSEHYRWLKNSLENGYQELNEIRKQIVHYTSLSTEYKRKHLQSVHSREEIEELQAEREELADFYKRHISLTLEGYENTLLFLGEVISAGPIETKSKTPGLIIEKTGLFPAFCPDCGSKRSVSQATHNPEKASTTCLECGTEVRIEVIRREYENGTLLQTIDKGRPRNQMHKITMWAMRHNDTLETDLTVKR